MIRPPHPSFADLFGVQTNAVALYLSDSRRPVETPEEGLQRLFGLTSREAAVLRALVDGDSMRRIAKRRDIGGETVKAHIRNILRKTGVDRQTQPIQLVLSSPAWIATPLSTGGPAGPTTGSKKRIGRASPKGGIPAGQAILCSCVRATSRSSAEMPAIEMEYPRSGSHRPLHALVTSPGVRHALARPWKIEIPWVLAFRRRRMAKAISDLIAGHRTDPSLIVVTFISVIGAQMK